MNYKVLADRVKYFKEDEKGVQTMCRVLEEMREEVREEERIKAIRCMIQFEIPKEKILSKGYSEEEYKVAKEKYNKEDGESMITMYRVLETMPEKSMV